MKIEYKTITNKILYQDYLKIYENLDFFHDFKMTYCLIEPEDVSFIALLGNKIVGICAIHKLNNLIYENLLVEVLPDYRDKKIAKELIKQQFDFLTSQNMEMLNPRYSSEGNTYIKKYFDESNLIKKIQPKTKIY